MPHAIADAPSARVTAFAAHHPADRTAVLGAIGLLWFGLLSGFFPDVVQGFAEGRGYQTVTHLHALTAFGWMSLLTWQALKVRAGDLAGHRRIGRRVGPALVAILTVSAVMTVFAADRARLTSPDFNAARLVFQLGHVVPFAVLTGWALAATRTPDAHKRLLLLGVMAILDAGFSRWVGRDVVALVGPGVAGQLLSRFPYAWALMAGMAAYDLSTRGRLHPVYGPAVGLTVGSELACTWLYFQPWWPDMARAILSL